MNSRWHRAVRLSVWWERLASGTFPERLPEEDHGRGEMMRWSRGPILFYLALLVPLLLVLGGCGTRGPVTVALDRVERPVAEEIWHRFIDRSCSLAVDADLRVGWKAWGQEGTVRATLLLQVPSFLRLALVDPLDRPVVLITGDGTSFTLVDNRTGEAYTGPVEAGFWKKYVPEVLADQELFFLLAGRLEAGRCKVQKIARDREGRGYWYTLRCADNLRHQVLLSDSGMMACHRILAGDELELEVTYEGTLGDFPCPWPRTLEIEGERVSGKIVLEFERIYSTEPVSPERFQLRLPSHVTLTRVR
ncbi:hypothetical protein GF1_15710 [Desulfolithobacter dissulfuricans]|uniref:DUF4292 domain-containing protein n=1 Tax=Desulfolithobacter dissulfuricans TaxID=2795293 RepID=A0A915U1P3_9BACT|nr:hypothetical protein [Desulfolithobacter dissulfuricans]BCO09195.1 hypothetical protein GF1_15710 [Desulfolithobacter dissulfuricans]